jgi:hypothetical protein
MYSFFSFISRYSNTRRSNSSEYHSNSRYKNYNQDYYYQNRSGRSVFQKLGGDPELSGPNNIIEKIKWENLDLPEIEKNFYQVQNFPFLDIFFFPSV